MFLYFAIPEITAKLRSKGYSSDLATQFRTFYYPHIFLRAASAMSLHDRKGISHIWKELNGQENGNIDKKYLGDLPIAIDYEKNPMAFMLALLDELQEGGRPFVPHPLEGARIPSSKLSIALYYSNQKFYHLKFTVRLIARGEISQDFQKRAMKLYRLVSKKIGVSIIFLFCDKTGTTVLERKNLFLCRMSEEYTWYKLHKEATPIKIDRIIRDIKKQKDLHLLKNLDFIHKIKEKEEKRIIWIKEPPLLPYFEDFFSSQKSA